MSESADIALFPLSAVLFPGGRIDLRIFEPRYLKLVSDCMREQSGFGVCRILEGRESGEPASPAACGTLANIVDFCSLPDGLLGITATGSRRFRVTGTRVRDNGLLHGEVVFLDDEPIVPVPTPYALLATIIERLHERSGDIVAKVDRARYDDASWVGFRLAEALPLAGDEHQQLLEMTDPLLRLARLMEWLPRFQRG